MTRPKFGYTLLELLVSLSVVAVLVGLVLSAVQKVRASAQKSACVNQLRQLALALQHSHDTNGRFPPGTHNQWGTQPYASWIARILPQIEQDAAYRDFIADYKKQIIFVGPPTHRNLARPLATVLCPLGQKQFATTDDHITAAFTYYLGNVGQNSGKKDGILFLDSKVKTTDITDGLSQSILIGERPPSPDNHFGWWYAGVGQQLDGEVDFLLGVRVTNQSFRAPTCPRNLAYPFRAGSLDDMCDAFHFWSLHAGGANFAFADGSVRFMSYSANDILPALASRAGGEVVNVPE